MTELISVVVPIYNVGEYLVECIDSILAQSYQNIEIILVDDGSVDGSGEICDLYKSDRRVKVIHQKNSGLTVARRTGVNAATGKYVTFVDGDDWIESGMYEALMKEAVERDADIVTSAGYKHYKCGIGKERLGDTVNCGEYEISSENHEILKCFFSSAFSIDEHINGAVWNKLFKRRIIKNVLNDMDDQVHGYMDDNVCVIGCALKSKKIYVTDKCFYHHRERINAFTYSQNSKGFLQINYAYLNLCRFLKESEFFEELYPFLYEHTSQRLMQAYGNFFEKQYVCIPEFYYKDDEIEVGSKVLLYGAGNVGRAYRRQFQIEKKYILVGSVDQQENSLAEFNLDNFLGVNFDYLVIAVYKKSIMSEIKRNLINLNIPESKIRWKRPMTLFEYYSK